ncbi:MAG: cell division protein FtsZ, partial [Clostridium sp.]|nr:cell division protein FtsZ [Clostridium sp.]
NAKVNVVAILPSLKEDELAFKNTIECWNDINSVMDMVNDVKFVDNNKRNTYKEINKEVIDSLDLAYNIIGIHPDGNIDNKDSFRINTADGTGLVLKLYDGVKDAKTAVDLAIENSVFVQPDIYDCDYLGINLKIDGYDPNEVSKCFEVYKSTYITYNNDNNIVVLGGCETPIEAIKLIKLSLDEKNKRKAARSRKRSVMIDIDDNYEKNEEISIDNFLDDDFQF